MSLKANDSKNSSSPTVAPMEAGTYPARLVQVIDLGLQTQRPFKGEPKDPAYSIQLTYEFVDEFMPDEDGNDDLSKPRWLSEDFPVYPLSTDRAKSTKRYLAFDPDQDHDGDFGAIGGSAAMVTISQSAPKEGKVYNNISNVSAMRAKEAKSCPELVNDLKVFSLEDSSLDTFLSLHDWVKKKVVANLEFDGSRLDKLIQAHEGGSTSKDEPPKESKAKETETDDGDEW